MGASRSFLLTVAGAASATALLVASPTTYASLRRRLRLESGRDHFESDFAAPLVDEPQAETAGSDLRLSLRARLAQDADAASAEQGAAAPSADGRERLRQARERLEAKAAAASAIVEAPGDPDVLEEDTADLVLPEDAPRR